MINSPVNMSPLYHSITQTPTMLRVSLLALACLLARALANEDQIVTPKIANGLDMGFVFIQGANISTQQYLPTASAILDQAASVNYRLWIGLPHCPMVSSRNDYHLETTISGTFLFWYGRPDH